MMTIAFLGYLLVIAIEYIGLSTYFPILASLKLTLILAFLLISYVFFAFSIKEVVCSRQAKLFLIFIFLTFLSLFFGLVRTYAIEPLQQQIGYFLLIVIGATLINSLKRIHIFLGIFLIIHVFLIILNIEQLVNPERIGVLRASYFLGDGNDFAWALVISLPFCLYLISFVKTRYKMVLICFAVIYVFGIISTQSRGASLALAASFLYYFVFIIKNKAMSVIAFFILILSVAIYAPHGYFDRMETIMQYQEDSSAMNRLRAWRTAMEMAEDNPVLGVGAGSFSSAYGRFYRKDEDPHRWISTHSIFFNVLAEYGYPGLFIFLSIIISNYRSNKKLLLKFKDNRPIIVNKLPQYINMGIVAYFVAGMFLTGVNYPHLYIITTLTLSIYLIAEKNMESLNRRNSQEEENLALS